MKEGIKIVEEAGEVPTGDSVKKAMCDRLKVAGGINEQSLDKEVRRVLEERDRQRREELIAALPPPTLDAAKGWPRSSRRQPLSTCASSKAHFAPSQARKQHR